MWAGLLSQNLTVRGASTTQCELINLTCCVSSMSEGSWLVLDGGWPVGELQVALDGISGTLRERKIRAVVVVDDLVGPHSLPEFRPDYVVNRAPDMRILVRDLLSVFSSIPVKSA